MFKTICFALTGAFGHFDKSIKTIELLTQEGIEVIPIVSTYSLEFLKDNPTILTKIETLTKHKVRSTIAEVEKISRLNLSEAIIVAPCTGNTLAKISNAITDNCVTMAVKGHLRNNKPVVLGISTNDGLGRNFKNIADLYTSKNFYFVPFGQDDYVKKPNSLSCDFEKIIATLEEAEEQHQIQPILL